MNKATKIKFLVYLVLWFVLDFVSKEKHTDLNIQCVCVSIYMYEVEKKKKQKEWSWKKGCPH